VVLEGPLLIHLRRTSEWFDALFAWDVDSERAPHAFRGAMTILDRDDLDACIDAPIVYAATHRGRRDAAGLAVHTLPPARAHARPDQRGLRGLAAIATALRVSTAFASRSGHRRAAGLVCSHIPHAIDGTRQRQAAARARTKCHVDG
jgi:hypothetical protein